MNEEIFRKKSLDKIKSPESLDDYIRVSNPGVWLLLISVIVLLVGACVWGIFGHIDSTIQTTVQVDNGKAFCVIGMEDISSVREGLNIKFADTEAEIESIEADGKGGYICRLSADMSVADGFYEGKAVIQSYKPISFILN